MGGSFPHCAPRLKLSPQNKTGKNRGCLANIPTPAASINGGLTGPINAHRL